MRVVMRHWIWVVVGIVVTFAGMGVVGEAAAVGRDTVTPAKQLTLRISDFPRGASLVEAAADGGLTASGVHGTSFRVRVIYPLGNGQVAATAIVGVTDRAAQARQVFASFRKDPAVAGSTTSKLRLPRLGGEQIAIFQVRKSDSAATGMLVVRSKRVIWMLSVIGRPELTRHRAVTELSKYGAKMASRVNAR